MKRITSPTKTHGGKGGGMASKIVALFPPRCKNPNAPADDDPGYLHYVEPYAGGLSVLLANDPEGISEVVNDIDDSLTRFWRIIQDAETFARFCRIVQAVPFSAGEWQDAGSEIGMGPVDKAAAFFVRCRQSLAGRGKAFAPLSRNRTRQGMNEQAAAWISAVDGLPAVHARLRRVVVLGPETAGEVICREDGRRTLFYLDPPYLPETRTSRKVYANEMTADQHEGLLQFLASIDGRFVLSGYRSPLYDKYAEWNDWRRVEFDRANAAAGGKSKRRMTEVCWLNYDTEGNRL